MLDMPIQSTEPAVWLVWGIAAVLVISYFIDRRSS